MKTACVVSFLGASALPVVLWARAELHPVLQRLPKFSVGAHQGGVFGPHGNNSIPQFEKALSEGADIIEMDLRITRDGVPVVFHDEGLAWRTNCRGKVRDKTLKELRRCRHHNTDDPIYSFAEVLAWVGGKAVVNAEFKDEETIFPAVRLVEEHQALDWVYFQTQSNRSKYQLARSLNADVALLHKVANWDDLRWVQSLQDSALIIVEVDNRMNSEEVVSAVRSMGKWVSQDSFDYDFWKEFFGAHCSEVFSRNLDIAISNRVSGCVKQRNARLMYQ